MFYDVQGEREGKEYGRSSELKDSQQTSTNCKTVDTLCDSIHVAILLQKQNLGPLVPLTELCKAIWRERNAHAYHIF